MPRRSEGGLSRLELLGLAGGIVVLVLMIPFVHDAAAHLVGLVFNQRDEAGHVTAFSQMMRGIGITLGAIVVFVGSGWLILQTNLGKRLAFLVTGAATTGWMVIGSFLFVIYAPRGIRPANLEGLDALQIRIPAIALTLASATLFVMFVLALDRYERDEP